MAVSAEPRASAAPRRHRAGGHVAVPYQRGRGEATILSRLRGTGRPVRELQKDTALAEWLLLLYQISDFDAAVPACWLHRAATGSVCHVRDETMLARSAQTS